MRREREADVVRPEYKSRLCGRGVLEEIDALRVVSFAAANRIRWKTTGKSNAYLQGDLSDRVLLLRLPDLENEDGRTVILARVPIDESEGYREGVIAIEDTAKPGELVNN